MVICFPNPEPILGHQDRGFAGPTLTFNFEVRENLVIHTHVEVVVICITYSAIRVCRRDRGFAGPAIALKFNLGIGAHIFTRQGNLIKKN